MTPDTKDAFAPRLGFAYDPTGDGKMVIRGGVGKFYEYQLIGVLNDLTQQAVISPAFMFETDEDESPLDGEIPSDPCLRPGGTGGPGDDQPRVPRDPAVDPRRKWRLAVSSTPSRSWTAIAGWAICGRSASACSGS